MARFTRREFLEAAIAIGTTAAWGAHHLPRGTRGFSEGVAGDSDSHSVVLWTRSPGASRATLHVEVAEDAAFERVMVTTTTAVSAESDWTCRVPTGGLQDARARWPFVCMWDNHEFSWLGWQSFQKFGADVRPAQKLKVAANQAFFESQPGRLAQPGGVSFERFAAPVVENQPITAFDAQGLGTEANNLVAIRSLRGRGTHETVARQKLRGIRRRVNGPSAHPGSSGTH